MDMRLSRSQKGYSLIEGMVALGIIAVVTGMTLLGFNTMLPNSKANSAVDQLLYQLRSAREAAIAHRCEVAVSFTGNNTLTLTQIWFVGNPPPPVTTNLEGSVQYILFNGVPDLPGPYNFGNVAAIEFEGQAGGPPLMKFTTNGSFIDAGGTFVNGTVFLGIPGNPSTARAISILGATGRVREYHWTGAAWSE
jgi:prepilin-type N-terminal cleavage/methylation domain-containing protein